MRTLLLKFFLSFWLIIAIIIGTAGAAGYWYAERLREAMDNFEIGDPLLEASGALASGGRSSLTEWLRDLPDTTGITLYVIDGDGRDLLDRRLPFRIRRNYQRHREHMHERRDWRTEPGNLRRSRPHPQLVAADGSVYTFMVSQSRISQTIWTNADARWLLFVFALLVSGGVSYILANAISRPVRELRDATLALADGNLDARVADSVGRRRDELGLLGRDFDAMADSLQRAALQQIELARNISHELRSPLARMRVAIELVRQHSGDVPELGRLETEALRLDELIGQILSYAKLDTYAELKPAVIDLVDLVRDVVENANYECKSAGIENVSVVQDLPEMPEVRGHRDALISAFENVLRNAVRHSPPRSEVRVAATVHEETVEITIRDHGPGVEAPELARLFEPFFRTHSAATSAAATGTGLGLAIAERAIKVNGGSIAASNHPDGGLLVEISLPL